MEQSIHDNRSLYHRTLGNSFDCLPLALKRFHNAPTGGTAEGSLCVTRGAGRMRHVLAVLMRLPKPGKQVPVRLQVEIQGNAECWTRDFGSLRLITRQWLHHGLLIETAGPLRFGFRLRGNGSGMRFEFARCWLMGLPLPRAFSPRVNASVSGQDTGWWVQVRIEVPVFGMLTQYEGLVVPQW
jgi:hypothetical protein